MMWTRPWPAWIASAVAAWAAVYTTVQVVWVLTDTTVPWSPHSAYVPALQLSFAVIALGAGGVCLAAERGARRRHVALLAAAVAVFAVGMASTPAYLAMLISLSGVDSVTAFAHDLLSAVGTSLLLFAAIACRRRTHGACPRCGRRHTGGFDSPLIHPEPVAAARRTRLAALAFLAGLVPWAAVKTIWTCGGDALGVSAEGWRALNEDSSGFSKALAAAGIDVTVLAAAVAVLLLTGLLFRWGQVFPRWTPILARRRVPRLLALVPAWLCAVGLTAYGSILTMYAPLGGTGILPAIKPAAPFTSGADEAWMIEFGGLAFAGLGCALLLAARSYAARTRPACGITRA
jgi:D-alanyl-D-alanine dipeptidase